MDKNFSLYLTKIGFLDENASKEIINSNKDKKNFVDSAFHYLMNFLDNLDENKKKYMSYFIPNNYKQIITRLRKEKIKSIFIRKILRQKLILLKYLYIWKRNINIYFNIMNINNEENHKNISNESDKLAKALQISQNTLSLDDYLSKENINKNKKNEISNIKNLLNSMNIKSYKTQNIKTFNKLKNKFDKKFPYNYTNTKSFKIKKPDYKYIYNNLYKANLPKKETKEKNKLLTSLESKELKDLKECTFKPRINSSSSKRIINNRNNKNKSKDNIMSVFDKLYKEEEKLKLTKELRTIDKDYTLGQNFSFTPNINNRYKKIYKYQDHKNFAERQREFKEKLDKKKEELRDEIDSQFELICSFNPKITNERGEYYKIKKKKTEKEKQPSSVFKRLYLDVMTRKNLKEEKEKENIDKFNEMANYLTLDKKINTSNVFERLIDYNKEDIFNKTKEKVEKEEGLTFKPEIEENDYIKNIEGTFLERNEQWLFNRNNFIEQENAKQIENIRNSGELNSKKYTREEREQIISNIIERLYKNNKKDDEDNNEEDNEEDNEEEDNEEQDEE